MTSTQRQQKAIAQRLYREARRIVLERSLGFCEMCGGKLSDDWEAHHRQARGMGGSTRNPRTWNPAFILASCGRSGRWCNQWVERAENWQRALEYGWRVSRSRSADVVPVWYRSQRWVLLDAAGGVTD